MRSTTILAATLAITLVACSDSASTLSGLAPTNGLRLVLTPGDAQIVMNRLDNPRGLAFSPDGVLYVTEAGRGGTSPCLTVPQVCYGPTGAVSRLRKGVQERFATGLPSLVSANGVAQAGPT